MPFLPRLAIGTATKSTQYQPLLWGLVDRLTRVDTHIQVFRSQANFAKLDGATAITGESPRHLDSWLMSADTCREVFAHGMRASDIGIVEGTFYPKEPSDPANGGRLNDLCDILDLPRIVVLDASRLKDCILPIYPERTDGILLDCVSDRDFPQMQTSLEALFGIPVLGSLGPLPGVRAVIEHLPPGSRPSKELCRRLGEELARHLQVGRLLEIANRPGFPPSPHELFCCSQIAQGLNVAVAYDEAFNCYFPDALELLELHGARIRDFSPLRDERLPSDSHLVYLGCGHPEHFAKDLASNHCMHMALRRHFCRGKRIYAEGGGAAYLCRQMALADGRRLPMVGLLPAVAWQDTNPSPLRPVELTLAKNNWLGEGTSRVRGYLNSHWVFQRTGQLTSCTSQLQNHHDLVAHHQTIGSRLHLNLVAQPHLIRNFLKPFPRELVTV